MRRRSVGRNAADYVPTLSMKERGLLRIVSISYRYTTLAKVLSSQTPHLHEVYTRTYYKLQTVILTCNFRAT